MLYRVHLAKTVYATFRLHDGRIIDPGYATFRLHEVNVKVVLQPPEFHSPPSRVATRNTRQTYRLIFFTFYDNQEGLFVVREFPHEVKMTSMSLLSPEGRITWIDYSAVM
jgi:hypothetical protein